MFFYFMLSECFLFIEREFELAFYFLNCYIWLWDAHWFVSIFFPCGFFRRKRVGNTNVRFSRKTLLTDSHTIPMHACHNLIAEDNRVRVGGLDLKCLALDVLCLANAFVLCMHSHLLFSSHIIIMIIFVISFLHWSATRWLKKWSNLWCITEKSISICNRNLWD